MANPKKTIIILPGWGGSAETWKDFIALAKEDFDVVCLDLPCFGAEPCPSTVWGVEEYADFVLNKIKKINGQPVVLFGHSFGGQIAAYIAAHDPGYGYIDKLILMGASALRPNRTIRRAFFLVMATVGKLIFTLPGIKKYEYLAKKILYKGIRSFDYSETSGTQRSIFKKVIRQDLSSFLPHITVPTLLIWGEHDSYIPLSIGKKIHGLIPNSDLHIIPDGRHGLHHTHGSIILNYIRSFV